MSHRDRDYDRGTRSADYDRAPAARAQPDAAPKIFVGNLHYDTTEDDFKSHFEHCGKIVEILIPRDIHNNNRVKGYGFVTFEDFESMQRAIEKMDGSKLLGNELKVDRAQERKERPAFNAAGAGGRAAYDDRGGSSDRGGNGFSDRGRYEDRVSQPPRAERKPVGYRCRIAGLARDIGWQLLKDFLRQAGDVTYANVDPDGFGVGEYGTYDECRDAIDKLSGAALDGNIVKLTALNFDYHTGERLDRAADRGSGGYSSRPAATTYDDRGSGRGYGGGDGGRDYGGDRRDYGGDRDRRDYNAPRSYDSGRGGTGGSSYKPYDSSYRDDRGSFRAADNGNAGYDSRGRDGGSVSRYGGGGVAAGGYDRNAGGGSGYNTYNSSRGGREQGRAGGSYETSARDKGGFVTGGGRYDSARGNSAGGGGGGGGYSDGRDNGYSPQPAAGGGGSSRYGGGGSWAGASSKYGGGGGAAPSPVAAAGGSSRYGGGGGNGYSRGAGGPDRRVDSYAGGRGSDRHGPYERPAGR